MPRFAANLHYLFSELPFLERFEAAAAAGFWAVEFQVPYDFPPRELSSRLRAHGLQMVLFDAPMGNGATATAALRPCWDARKSSGQASRKSSTTQLRCSAIPYM